MEFLKRLCETDGISGREDAVLDLLRAELGDHLDEIRTDAMKNFIGLKRGTAEGDRTRVMLSSTL